MKYVYIPREADKQQLLDNENHFKELSDKELIKAYHRQVRTHITGVHAQALYLLALRKVMKQRFGKSPITLKDGSILDLG
jgi:hypothetical protein